MKILLLGGGGFIGRNIARKLSNIHDICIFDLCTKSARNIDCKKICGDVRKSFSRVKNLIKEYDLIIDLIAYANPKLYVDKPLETFHTCFTENLKIVEHCARYQKKLIQFSTCEVYGNHGDACTGWVEDETVFCSGPIHEHRWIYANAKQTLERLVDIYAKFENLEYTIIRPFNFVGHDIDFLPSKEGGCPRVFSHFLDSILGSGNIKLVNGGKQKRSYTYIKDAIDCIEKIIDNPGSSRNQIFNIGSPQNETSIKQMADLMINIALDQHWIKWPPAINVVSGQDFYGKGYADIDRRVPNIDKAERLLGWRPSTSLRDTLLYSMQPWFE